MREEGDVTRVIILDKTENGYEVGTYTIALEDFLIFDEDKEQIKPGPLMEDALSEVALAFVKEELAKNPKGVRRIVQIAYPPLCVLGQVYSISRKIFSIEDYFEEGQAILADNLYVSGENLINKRNFPDRGLARGGSLPSQRF